MPLITITAPTVEPVTDADIAVPARLDGTEFNAHINGVLIPAFRAEAESLLSRRLITQTVELVLDAFPAGPIDLTLRDAQSITSIKYLDPEGIEQTLSGSVYQLDTESIPSRALLKYGKTWPSTQTIENAVRVRYVVGYGASAASVPNNIRLWIMAHVCQALDNPSGLDLANLKTIPYLDRLLDAERVWWVG